MQKKDAKYLNVNISTPIYDELDVFSSHTGISKTAAVEHALRMYMNDFYSRNLSLQATIMNDLAKGDVQ